MKAARYYAIVDGRGVVQSEIFYYRKDAVAELEAVTWAEDCRLVKFVEERPRARRARVCENFVFMWGSDGRICGHCSLPKTSHAGYRKKDNQ